MKRSALWYLTCLVTLVLMLNGVGWVPEPVLRVPGLRGASYGELFLVLACIGTAVAGWPTPRGGAGRWVYAAIAAIVLLCLVNILRNVWGGVPGIDVLRNSRRMSFYLVFFVLIGVGRKLQGERTVIRMLSQLFWLGVASYLLVEVVGVPLGGRIELVNDPGTVLYERVYHTVYPLAVVVGILAMGGIAFAYDSYLLGSNRVNFVVASTVVILSYYRNYYISYGLAVLTIMALAVSIRGWKMFSLAFRMGVVSFMVLLALLMSGRLESIQQRALSTGREVSQFSGTFLTRLKIWDARWQAASTSEKVLGRGFRWEDREDITTIEVNLDPDRPSSDSGYGTTLVIGGLVANVLWLALVGVLAGLGRVLMLDEARGGGRAIGASALGLAVFLPINNFGLDNFYWPFAVVPNLILIAATVLAVEGRTRADSPALRGPGPGVIT